ncbi:MAG TPA: class I SAM-dependent methyltransferase [Candidatus Angelobacter sp.]|jgi:tocopherol O-methyltransferase|nr:class I SAM-dependent methyltransferase [Candidatus Angelobacter sp.]
METAVKRSTLLNVNDISGHYDDFAWAYRLYWGDHIHHGLFTTPGLTPKQAQETMLRHCALRAAVRPGMTVADVGCGHGGTARFLASEYSCSVLGLTISAEQLKIARKLSASLNGSGSVCFELDNAETFEFPPAHFDLIWNMESSEHFFDKPAYFRKVAKALKPGGTLMVAAWTGSMEHELIREIARVFLCPELQTSFDYAEQMQAAGLKVVHSEELASEVVPTWDICSEHARAARSLLPVVPEKFRSFAEGIELMRQGYRNGQLVYSVMVAQKR